MPLFDVQVTWTGQITVTADNEEQAVQLAGALAQPSDFDEFDGEVLDGPYEEDGEDE